MVNGIWTATPAVDERPETLSTNRDLQLMELGRFDAGLEDDSKRRLAQNARHRKRAYPATTGRTRAVSVTGMWKSIKGRVGEAAPISIRNHARA